MRRNSHVTDQVADGRSIALQTGHHEIDQRRPSGIGTGVLWVVIPYTTPDLTRAALRHAGVCSDLDVHVVLVDIQVVPFPCPLDQPPVSREFSETRLHQLIKESRLTGHAAVLYTRDRLETLNKLLEPKSLVILATQTRWWPTCQQKLARALTKTGHHVMLLPVVR